MKKIRSLNWNGFAASVPGNGHLRREVPCQDASAYVDAGHPALIALDGRGSSALSQEGSAEGVYLFASTLGVLKPLLDVALDRPSPSPKLLRQLPELMHRALVQAKYNCVQRHKGDAQMDDFDFTAAVVVAGKYRAVCMQVGDGAIVVRENGVCRVVFVPDKGEAANCTRFVREGDDGYRVEYLSTRDVDAFAVMTDGPEHRMLDLRTMSPGPAFDSFFDGTKKGEFDRGDLLEFLTCNWWSRGNDVRDDDDRTLGLMAATPKSDYGKKEKKGK